MKKILAVIIGTMLVLSVAGLAMAAPGCTADEDICLSVERGNSGWHETQQYHDGDRIAIAGSGLETFGGTFSWAIYNDALYGTQTRESLDTERKGDRDISGLSDSPTVDNPLPLTTADAGWALDQGTPTERRQFVLELSNEEATRTLSFTISQGNPNNGPEDPADPEDLSDDGNNPGDDDGNNQGNQGNQGDQDSNTGDVTPAADNGNGLAGDTTQVEEKRELGAIRGTVTDADTGEPIGGAKVVVRDSDGTRYGDSMTTSGSGKFSKSGVAAGSYRVTASAAGYESDSGSAHVSDGETAIVNLRLRKVEENQGDEGQDGTISEEPDDVQAAPDTIVTEEPVVPVQLGDQAVVQGAQPEATVIAAAPTTPDAAPLPNTGGNDLVLMLQGLSLVGTGAYLRRKRK